MIKFGIFSMDDNKVIMVVHAANATEAADVYAQNRSGYECFPDMCNAPAFRAACDITISPLV